MKVLFIFALVAVLQASPLHIQKKPFYLDAVKADWEDCLNSDDLAKVLSVTLTPDPPAKGQDLKVDAEIELYEEIDSGSVELKITYGIFNIPVRTVTFDLCTVAEEDCPLKEKVSLSISDEIPGASPSGNYKGKAEVTDQSGRKLVCIEMKFQL
ncbi:PREDICTED: putative phosphatidylglycerol/phosphatidylinositol transfer protein DDB_G0282107 [Amphimedon queenslandica]|uniref:MD-2-related lipid-recognition domain-containing protein n=1 Tax=Amphimedon queenslandica TaxID=400682 RepID=A0A1X7UME8_AMPQE|nr:PREDICTED: putative phosphatidylglycerol/phosphatidylinositol transfer protein DDB_G0282107 [Amphimedon queenslandica]|eukprot:XP_011404563.1 PREDICTED: putative phosphatidylglycerol/phosphatidylinositol transfer protein DDB_G0282107 [Amphimedon queenslandica]